MVISRNSKTKVFEVKYPLFDFFQYVIDHGPAGTRDIAEMSDCSYATCFNKLQALKEIGVVASNRVGNAHQWSANTSTIDVNKEAPDIESQKVTRLVISAVESFAEKVINRGLLTEEIPNEYLDWLTERGMDYENHFASTLSRASSFDCLLKSTLYSLHQDEHSGLSPLRPSDDFPRHFEKAKRTTGDLGFDLIVPSSLWSHLRESDYISILALRHALAIHPEPSQLLSQVYENLIPQKVRRDLGQFATPPYISRLLAQWSVQDRGDTVLDPGIGSGILSSAVVRRKKKLGADTPLTDVLGNDIDGLSIAMASVALKLIDGPGSPSLNSSNFLETKPHTWTNQGRVQSDSVDAVISNPPYSRSQALSDQKTHANQIVSGETGFDFHGKTPLYIYFLVHAAQFVREGGRLAAIIPSGFMRTDYGIQFKQYLTQNLSIEAIIRLSSKKKIFDGVKITPSILLLENEPPEEDHETTFLDVPNWPSDVDMMSVLEDNSDQVPTDMYRIEIAQQLLSSQENWMHYFSPTDVDELQGLNEFREIATIQRGIATGKNSLFCFSKDELDEHDIPEKYLKPIIKRARDIPGYVIEEKDWKAWRDEGIKAWLLYCYEDGEKVLDRSEPGLDDFLTQAEEAGENDRRLMKSRNPWYCVDKRHKPPILAKYMTRTGFQFIRNEAEVRSLNNFHNVSPDFKDNEQYMRALLAYLNSNTVLRELSKLSRDYSGLEKIEVGSLKAAPALDPRELDTEKVEQLASLFGKLEKEERNDGDVEAVQSKVDTVINEILNRTLDDEDDEV